MIADYVGDTPSVIHRRIYDLSPPLTSTLPVWPGDPPVVVIPVARLAAGDDCNVSAVSLSCHAGAHVDVPWHFDDAGARLDEIPIERWIGPCYVADLQAAPRRIEPHDLDAALIPPATDRLLLRTANANLARLDSPAFSEEFSGLTPDAARWIIDRGVRLIGIDSLSIEPFDLPNHEAHRLLLGNDVLIIEGLDLSAVPAGFYELWCLPLNLPAVDGAPARVLLVARA